MFVRICVDVDQLGQVKGSSYELHDQDGLVSFVTDSVCPFDSPEEAFADLLAAHRQQFGTHQTLF